MEVVQIVSELGKALWNLKVMYDQHVENGNEIKELQSFIQDYDHQIPVLRERFEKGGGNVMGIAAFKNLEKDVMEATTKLERWSRNKSFFRLFNSVERMQKLEKLHSKVMASVQKSLGIANLSMLLDMQATQSTILESNAELKSLLITNIGSRHGMLPSEVRDEVVEASTSSFGDPKFWEDILAAVDNHNASVSLLEEKSMYEDPITTNLMIDPVVASDGNTYCRWTIIDNNLTSNPFNVDEDLTIVIDNLNFRRVLFEKFPEQAQIFRQRRTQYRSHALSLKAKGLLGDAILALHYVLQWDKRDVECVEALEQVQRALEVAKEKYLQPSMGISNELSSRGSIGSSVNDMVVESDTQRQEAYKSLPRLLSSILEVRQQAAYSASQWSRRDIKFQNYIVKKGGVAFLARLLPSSNQITQNHLVSILCDISESLCQRRPKFVTNQCKFQDALEPIAEILKKGSTEACEQAAKIFFNLSTSPDRTNIIENSMAMLALVTSLGNETPQVQQIASDTLNNLFPDSLEPIVEILKGGSVEACEQAARVLFNLSTMPDKKIILGNSVAMLTLLISLGDGTLQVQQIAINIVKNLFPDALEPIAEILKKGLAKNRKQAASILLNLSTTPDKKIIIENYVTMLALVTSLGNGTFQFQQITTDTLNNLFPESLKPISKILKEGSTKAREQAARILFNLSTSDDNGNAIGNSVAMLALVISLGNGTVQLQQIVASTLNNLCRHFMNETQAIEAGLVPVLLRLIIEQSSTMLDEALPLVNEVLNFSNQSRSCHVIRMEAHASIWLEIMASKSPLNRERAASILYTLCYDDQQYREQTKGCQAYKQIRQFALPVRTSHTLFELLNSNVSDKNYHKRQEIPFPKKDWWPPQKN